MSQPPVTSPDGRQYWDGTRWVPLPVQVSAASPLISPDGGYYWNGQVWLPTPGQMARAVRSPLLGWLGALVAVILIVALAGVLLSFGPQRWTCTVQYPGHAMQVTVEGVFAGFACDQLINEQAYSQAAPAGDFVCGYTIGLRRYSVRDQGFLPLLGRSMCQQLDQLHRENQQPSTLPRPTT